MFGNRDRDQRIKDLQAELSTLRERLDKVESSVEPFRVGDDWRLRTGCYWTKDDRPAVSISRAIELLLEHCKVEFKAVKANVTLEKKVKSHTD